ncbi:NUDIX domain-containing protein [Komagataeibacter intermedius]|uniref:ADP-ribose pyrophosphatase n=2 Tax=Komagataeibacter intermedius TaxID=66229 RepID=A0A0N1F6R8_9PROT|nr:NUDIX domain-containing protein [Komagataeibacter intermedius]KPH85159.1 ADP-ribose pyrophosphatase [Komagataeibacter intermedius AF2]MCF3638193.1 NUDIX domain-containing protein [Komagataeibacter intermedius]GAN85720.1 ADP-ribose pyrophosphatase/hydrolase [Komagataeibacter intermedius TF2]GBQ78360.1 ADP-ribose pyrophosphatase [Komagataeibacter intermedius NRIC 0521]
MTAITSPRVGCGAAIMDGGGRILLLRRLKQPEAGCWGLPGGKVDPYETTAHAAEREIREELGIIIQARDLLCLVEQMDARAGYHWLSPVYLVTSWQGMPTLMEPDKHEGPCWYALDGLPADLTEPTRHALAALRMRSERSQENNVKV